MRFIRRLCPISPIILSSQSFRSSSPHPQCPSLVIPIISIISSEYVPIRPPCPPCFTIGRIRPLRPIPPAPPPPNAHDHHSYKPTHILPYSQNSPYSFLRSLTNPQSPIPNHPFPLTPSSNRTSPHCASPHISFPLFQVRVSIQSICSSADHNYCSRYSGCPTASFK